MIIIVDKQLTKEDVQKAREEYGDYIKITIDIIKKIVAIGGEYHADAEKILIDEYNSKSENILGGGYNITNNSYEFTAMINLRPSLGNNSMEILNLKKRATFEEIAKDKLKGIKSLV